MGLRSMRSYYAHLETAMGSKSVAKPVFRSSAIFPVIQREGISSRILFMGYWILKRHIQKIAGVITLRSLEGKILNRSTLDITEAKTYRIELADQLANIDYPANTDFMGSLEIEFFSVVNLVFPFPATVINYYGPHFSSVVHTAQRVYNDFEDLRANSQTSVPESGFNIYAEEDREPFIGLINGPNHVADGKISMQLFNIDREELTYELNLGEIAPYQTQIIHPAELMPLKKFLKGQVGAGKIRFNVSWIFPRLVVGNIQQSPPAMTITHTYYDCSAAQSDSDYWLPEQPKWYSAALMVPLCNNEKQFTNIYFYPLYSPSSFIIDIEIYDSKGKRLGSKQNVLAIESPFAEIKQLNIAKLCQELEIPPQKDLAARVIGRAVGDSRFPARVKLGLDIGLTSQPHMPCNICTNLQPFNPALETKPSTFRWSPVLADQPESVLWILNSSPERDYQKTAELDLTFFREKDSEVLKRHVTIPPHGFIVIRPQEDPELQGFFEGKVGWCTAVSTNPYTTDYYFAINPSGVVGGDHSF